MSFVWYSKYAAFSKIPNFMEMDELTFQFEVLFLLFFLLIFIAIPKLNNKTAKNIALYYQLISITKFVFDFF